MCGGAKGGEGGGRREQAAAPPPPPPPLPARRRLPRSALLSLSHTHTARPPLLVHKSPDPQSKYLLIKAPIRKPETATEDERERRAGEGAHTPRRKRGRAEITIPRARRPSTHPNTTPHHHNNNNDPTPTTPRRPRQPLPAARVGFAEASAFARRRLGVVASRRHGRASNCVRPSATSIAQRRGSRAVCCRSSVEAASWRSPRPARARARAGRRALRSRGALERTTPSRRRACGAASAVG